MHTPIVEKARRLLEIVAKRSQAGLYLRIDQDEIAPLIDGASIQEVNYLLDYLRASGYADIDGANARLTSGGLE